MEILECTHSTSGAIQAIAMMEPGVAPHSLVEHFRRAARACPHGYRATLYQNETPIVAHVTSESEGAALVTIQIESRLVASAVIASGVDRDGDDRAISELYRMIEYANGTLDGCEMDEVADSHRPIVLIVLWPEATREDALAAQVVLRAIAVAHVPTIQ